jgi:hypothetical protein
MKTDNHSEQDLNEDKLKSLFKTDTDGDDMPRTALREDLGKSDAEFLDGVKTGIEKKTRTRRLLGMLPAFIFTVLLAFLVLPALPLIMDSLQINLPESAAMLIVDLGDNTIFKLGIVMLFGLGLPWFIDYLEQQA